MPQSQQTTEPKTKPERNEDTKQELFCWTSGQQSTKNVWMYGQSRYQMIFMTGSTIDHFGSGQCDDAMCGSTILLKNNCRLEISRTNRTRRTHNNLSNRYTRRHCCCRCHRDSWISWNTDRIGLPTLILFFFIFRISVSLSFLFCILCIFASDFTIHQIAHTHTYAFYMLCLLIK